VKRLMIFGFVTLTLFAAATTMLWSHPHSTDRSIASGGAMSSQERHTTAGAKLPIEEFEDMSLVFSSVPKP